MRVLLDANLFISFLLSPKRDTASSRIVRAAILGKFVLMLPEELLTEFANKVRLKPYLSNRIHPDEVKELVLILSDVVEVIPKITESIPAVTRDPKDDYLIAYAVVGAADYLVTGDQDLLVLGQIDNVKIVNPRTFDTLLEE